MWRPVLLVLVPSTLFVACGLLWACGTSNQKPYSGPGTGSSGSSGGGPFADAGGEGGLGSACVGETTALPPATTKCAGDPAQCLSGSASSSGFQAKMKQACAVLYDTFPDDAVPPMQMKLVAEDGSWAFDVPDPTPWGHYYVRIVGAFALPDDAGWSAVPVTVGPLSLPASGPVGTARIQPVELSVTEEKIPGGPLLVQQASARLFDPVSAAKIEGTAQVTITVGGVTTPIPWGHDPSGQSAYFLQFAQPPAAQSSYEIATTVPEAGPFHLQSSPATFDAVVTSPPNGAIVHAGQDLSVAWPAQPGADFEVVELFAGHGSTWAASQVTPPLRADKTGATVAVGDAGSYLLNVLFTKGNCSAPSDGCVFSESDGTAQVTAQ
jgi:hypothetical protein